MQQSGMKKGKAAKSNGAEGFSSKSGTGDYDSGGECSRVVRGWLIIPVLVLHLARHL